MELMDTFSKYDVQLDASCKKNEKMFFEVCKELQIAGKENLTIEKKDPHKKGETIQMSVADYIKNFKWDQVRFATDKSLKVIGAQISGKNRTCEDRLKKLLDEQTEIKNKLQALSKKEGNNFLTKDLGDIVYEKDIPGKLFVNTHGSEMLTTLLVVVNKKKVDQFKSQYPNLLREYQAGDLENWKKRTEINIQAQN